MNRISPFVLALTLAACRGEGAGPADTPATPAAPATAAAPSPTEDAAAAAPQAAVNPTLPAVTLYKSPTCGCCAQWGEHMREAGFRVEAVDVPNIDAVHRQYGIPQALQACHTGVVEGYVVEGHVPAEDVKRLLRERPEAGGLAVPGMPVGSPGMEQGDVRQPYDVLLIDDGQPTVFARH